MNKKAQHSKTDTPHISAGPFVSVSHGQTIAYSLSHTPLRLVHWSQQSGLHLQQLAATWGSEEHMTIASSHFLKEELNVSRVFMQYVAVSLIQESDASGKDVGDEVEVGESAFIALVAFDERRSEVPCAKIEESFNPSKIKVILIIVVTGYSSRSPFSLSMKWTGTFALHAQHLICEETALICWWNDGTIVRSALEKREKWLRKAA
jgi:hypothetical protein